MEFSVAKADLLKELSFLNNVVEKKTTIPILSNILLSGEAGSAPAGNVLTLAGTDLDATLKTSCPAAIRHSGTALLPARRLFDIVRNLPDADIHFKSDGSGNMTITCERSRFRLFSPAPEGYPALPEIPALPLSVSSGILRTMIPRVLFATSQEESRYQLNGVQMVVDSAAADESQAALLRMVATDGHRLALIERPGCVQLNAGAPVEKSKVEKGKTRISFLIPKKTMAEIVRLAADTTATEIAFGQDDRHVFFQIGGRTFASRLLAGQFPNYEGVMPKSNDKIIVFETDLLVAALKRVGVVADETTHAVKLHATEGRVEITSQSPESGEAVETLSVDYPGPSMTITFNVGYLMDFLAVAHSTQTRFEFKDEITQIQLRPVDGDGYDYRYVVMPMRA
ncbi:DNA polymerase III subunit beta [Chloracidobacterium thermophilum]|uniref:Beta sliding clamp n=1 Tax=Chloracidobacterium thermophilum (strain B) TaxID=981222 RepID=G2LFD5_CHLTF|nr:DNA polymerase III subunit beta [Chloracidobacterium thermophilum]AEP10868.1 DNA polymerase III, beta subunit [Chloracidobacterium thermophilum B]QUV78800.1 DNA polymerase III subunit beta [Chloracidobacterium thermophilum]